MKIIILNKKEFVTLTPKAPYNFDVSVFKPSHYPDPLKMYEKGNYWFVLRFDDKIYGIKMQDIGGVNNPRIKVGVFSKKSLTGKEIKIICEEIAYRFEFNFDITEFSRKFSRDEILGKFIKKWYGMHGSCAQDLYGLLMIGIFLQNTIVKRTVQMTNDMLAKYGIKALFDGKEVYGFWKPEEMAKANEDELRKLKVGYRAKLFIKTSETFVKEKVDEYALRKMNAEEAKKELLKIYGVGPETARILLHEALHHYGIFEHVSPWQQKIYSRLLFNKELVPVEKIIVYVNKNWGEYAALAAGYIWEDIFWRRKQGEKIEWLEKEIRL